MFLRKADTLMDTHSGRTETRQVLLGYNDVSALDVNNTDTDKNVRKRLNCLLGH